MNPFCFHVGVWWECQGTHQLFFFGGAYALSLTVHVSLLYFFRLVEIACNICDVDQGPRVVIAL